MTVKLRKWRSPDGTKQQAWTIRISARMPDGTPVEVRQNAAVSTKQDALDEELELRRQIRDGTYRPKSAIVAPVAEDQTLAQFSEVWQARNERECDHGTHTFYGHCLKVILPQMGALPVKSVEFDHIEAFKAHLHTRDITNTYRNNILRGLRALLGYAAKSGKFGKGVRAPGVDLLPSTKQAGKYLTAAQVVTLLAWVAVEAPAWLALFTVLLGTGLRIGELIALEWRDVDLKGEILHVNRMFYRGRIDEIAADDAARRAIPLEAEVLAALKGLPRELHNRFVFPGTKHPHMTEASHRDVFARAGEFLKAQAGEQGPSGHKGVEPYTRADNLSPHCLRHTFATRKVSEGVALEVLAKLMGHASIVTTQVYAKVTDDVLRAAMGQKRETK